MTLEEKLDQFYNVTIESATAMNLAITEEYKTTLANALEEHKKSTKQKAQIALNLDIENAKREKNRVLSSASIKIRRKLSEQSACITASIFDEVTDKIMDFMKSEEYYACLIKQITEAKTFARKDEMKLYIDPSDENLKDKLEAETGVTITISTTNFIGGTRAVIPDKNILIDHSFSSKLQELKENFTL